MDRTDYKILNLLQQDSRITLRSIGEQVGLTPPAVSERIRKMEEDGVIRSFRVSVDRTLLDCSMTGFIFVAPEPEKTPTPEVTEQPEETTAPDATEQPEETPTPDATRSRASVSRSRQGRSSPCSATTVRANRPFCASFRACTMRMRAA